MLVELRQMPRQPWTSMKDYTMSVISFKRLDWDDLVVNVVDLSPQGIGIEVEKKMEPGFVWFNERVDGSKGGLLMWSKQMEGKYRGGIKFVPLTAMEEEQIQQKLERAGPRRDPTDVIDTILDSLKRSGGGSIVQVS